MIISRQIAAKPQPLLSFFLAIRSPRCRTINWDGDVAIPNGSESEAGFAFRSGDELRHVASMLHGAAGNAEKTAENGGNSRKSNATRMRSQTWSANPVTC